MLVGVVIAVPVRAALDLTTPTWRELRAVLITVAGLATFMWGVNPATSTTRPSPDAGGTDGVRGRRNGGRRTPHLPDASPVDRTAKPRSWAPLRA